jgi:crotonobetainyl-CoA:carnitine CoA-transferase CaiB-like acyl-CoA transferase
MDSVFGGLRVVDFSAGMAGPMAAGIMADYGAEVIKVFAASTPGTAGSDRWCWTSRSPTIAIRRSPWL